MTDRLEALADAIANLNGWADPSSRAYQIRNPLLLRAYSLSRMQDHDDQGYRIFECAIAGYRAGLYDLTLKCRGQSRSKLAPMAKLRDLLATYGLGNRIALKHTIHWLERALPAGDRGEIDHEMKIEWFLNGQGDSMLNPLPGEMIGKA